MGYLTFEIGLYLVLAFLLGLFVGWWIFAKKAAARVASLEQDSVIAQKALEDCQSARKRIERDSSAARTKLSDANVRITELEAALAAAKEETAQRSAASETPTPAEPANEPLEKPQGLMSAVPSPDDETKAKLAASPFLDAPVGEPDDLMLIKGVGPKLSGTLNSLGVYHFFQIAGWSEADVATVDDKLTFKGRIVRDNWIDQSALLAAGDHEAFTAKYGELGENTK